MKQTLDQKRAAHAWKAIELVKGLPPGKEERRKSFKAQIKRTPTRIVSSGLGQALAFLRAKKYAPDLYEALSEWIGERRRLAPGTDLLEAIRSSDAAFLRYATAESLAYLEWLVRFAEAENLVGGED